MKITEWSWLALLAFVFLGCGDDSSPSVPSRDMQLSTPDMAMAALCTDTCAYANDGECDDGGPGALYSECALGTDCADCGPRDGGCTPDCTGRACGDDGCGGSCGACASGTCGADGQCSDAACRGGMVQCSELTGSRREHCAATAGCTPVDACYGASRECHLLGSRSDCEAWSECAWVDGACENRLDCPSASTESECLMRDLRPMASVFCRWDTIDCGGSSTVTCSSFDSEADCLGHGCRWE